ncbi:MAG: hypothetical protein KGJ66_05780 [Alphaproteobacteria bacterium]|nr:hypothetical protein [Alphaproteobacteria bacterium]
MPLDGSDYEVGYGKPPAETRFKKGQSGNPSGRPRGRQMPSLAEAFEAEFAQRIPITLENGRRKKITKMEAMVKQVVNRAAQGDARFIRIAETLALAARKPAGNRESDKNSGPKHPDSIDFSLFTPEERKEIDDAARVLEMAYLRLHLDE